MTDTELVKTVADLSRIAKDLNSTITFIQWAAVPIIGGMAAAIGAMWFRMNTRATEHQKALEQREKEKDELNDKWRASAKELSEEHKQEISRFAEKSNDLTVKVTRVMEHALNIPPAADIPARGGGQ